MTRSRTRDLAPHVHAAAFGCDLVLLDVRSGDYDLVAAAGDAVTLSLDRRTMMFDDLEAIDVFEAMGVFDASSEPNAAFGVAVPRRSIISGPVEPLEARDWFWMAAGWVQMVGRFYGRPFPKLILRRRSDSSRRETAHDGDPRLLHKARAFDRLFPWTPFAGDCLYRCAMLLHQLGDDADRIDWVFGVRTGPFLAHCWLQCGDLVLTDAAEAVTLFSPILVV